MASPESNRTGGSRPSGAGGVKGLLAMFEKSTSSGPGSPAPGNVTATNPASRDQSPAPRPLGRVRTSFVAVTGNSGGMLGLQKVPVSPSMTSPTISFPEGQKLSGEALEALGKEQAAIDKMDETAEAIDRMKLPDELSVKKDFGNTNGHGIPPKEEPAIPTELLPAFEKAPIKKKETTTETSPEPVPVPKEQQEQQEEQVKPVKEDLKPKTVTVRSAPPRSPTKSAFSSSKVTKATTTNKSGKNLSLPPSKSNTTSPLPSPAFPPKSPARSAASASSSTSRTKPTTPPTSTTTTSTRTRIGTSASVAAVTPALTPKPRPATTTAKAKAPTTQKSEVPKPAREPTKPPTIRSSAFAPTAASAAKLAADQKATAARSRPPSSASVRNRSPPDGSVAMRRGNSGTGSSRSGRKEQRSPQRPQTSAAIRNTNRSSVGSLASIAPGGAGSDFLSRMMRPTTASAGKVSDKKPPVGLPSKRSASVASTSRRREPSLPPSIVRLQKQKTGEKKLDAVTANEIVPELKEPEAITEATQEPKVEGIPKESTEDSVEQTPIVEAPITKENEVGIEEEDEGQSPTTTTSSTTLVHESEGKDNDEEPMPLSKE